MQDAVLTRQAAFTKESSALARIAAMRANLKGSKNQALENWKACQPKAEMSSEREIIGRFTGQLAPRQHSSGGTNADCS